MLILDIQRDTATTAPDDRALRRPVELALATIGDAEARLKPRQDWELSLRVVDRSEMQTLNAQFRGKDGVTNVLSFPAEFPPGLPEDALIPLPLGDLVICAPVVLDEARDQGKAVEAHWDHMLIHGTLHLLGFDHQTEHEAETMEKLETRLLGELNWPCPYALREVQADEHGHAGAPA